MPKSPAFIRIKSDVLKIVAAIPPKRVCTYQAIGEHLDVMPRHVAYILAQLTDTEKLVYPWYRVVAADGGLGTLKRAPDGRTQADLLRDEGLLISQNSIASSLARTLIAVAELPSGVPRQTRPALIAPAQGNASKVRKSARTTKRARPERPGS